MSEQENTTANALDRLSRMPGHLMRRANQLVVAMFHEECRDLSITPVQFASLCAISSTGTVDVTRLSHLVGFDKATLGSVIDRLEGRGIVRREQHPIDRRIKLLTLTDKGNALLEAALPLVETSQKKFLAALDQHEQAAFLHLLKKVSGLT